MPSLQPLSIVSEAEISTVGAPLLQSELSSGGNCDRLNSVHSVYVSVCSFRKSFPSNVFSLTMYTMKLFNANSLSSLVLRDLEEEFNVNNVELSREVIVHFVSKSTAKTKSFKKSVSAR